MWALACNGHGGCGDTVDVVDAAEGSLGRCGRVVDMVDVAAQESLVVLWSHSNDKYQFFLTKMGVI